MNSKERKIYILNLLQNSSVPLKGQDIAEGLGVTRQVIVKDIALLRAEGKNIIATPEGYMFLSKEFNKIRRVIAVCHSTENIEDELKVIVSYGGIIEDVIIEHPLYGELRAMLMLKNLYDVKKFMEKFLEYKAEPLSALTGGVHLHTIVVEDEDTVKKIIDELKKKNYLLKE